MAFKKDAQSAVLNTRRGTENSETNNVTSVWIADAGLKINGEKAGCGRSCLRNMSGTGRPSDN